MDVLNGAAQQALQRIIEQLGIKHYQIKTVPATNQGDNYGGILHRIEVSVDGNHDHLSLVCKVPIEIHLNLTLGFQREVFIYQQVLRSFDAFQTLKGLNTKNRFTSYVHCYEACDRPGNEYLIMEDLKAKSFVMLDKLSKIDRDHAELFVRGLAKFHALSFAIKDQKPEEFKKLSCIKEVLIGILSEKAYYEMCEFGLNQALSSLEDGDPEHKEKVRNVKDKLREVVPICLNGVGSEDYRVINHADCWNNNMMFRYENGKPVEVRIFDWQLSRYCSPVVDLVNYFYNSTEKELLENHFDDLMSVYYEQLTQFVSLLGSDPEQVYPHEQFQKDLKRFAVFPFIACTSNLTILVSNPEKPPELGKLEADVNEVLDLQDERRKCLYNARIKDIVKHAVDRGFI